MPPAPLRDVDLFSMYMQVTGVPTLGDAPAPDPRLRGKKLGLVNGSSWISLWTSFFGRRFLPGVKLVACGSDGIQLNFMDAHSRGLPCPPQTNIDLFCRYAKDLHRLVGVDAILITCSTMNRAIDSVRAAMKPFNVPVVGIDEAMMKAAVNRGGRILVVATHGPTVRSTEQLLRETAARLGREPEYAGVTVEDAFHLLGEGDITGHNQVIAEAIRHAAAQQPINSVVLAQLSMSVFSLEHPDCEAEFGMPVYTSGETGFAHIARVLAGLA